MTDTSSEAVALAFHEAYERLAPSFGYETRPETREFAPKSPNGQLMIAVAREAVPVLAAQLAAEVAAHAETRAACVEHSAARDRQFNLVCALKAENEAAGAKIVQMAAAWGADAVRVEELTAEVARLRGALAFTADQALAAEIPVGYGPKDKNKWTQGYDAAIRHARAALQETKP